MYDARYIFFLNDFFKRIIFHNNSGTRPRRTAGYPSMVAPRRVGKQTADRACPRCVPRSPRLEQTTFFRRSRIILAVLISHQKYSKTIFHCQMAIRYYYYHRYYRYCCKEHVRNRPISHFQCSNNRKTKKKKNNGNIIKNALHKQFTSKSSIEPDFRSRKYWYTDKTNTTIVSQKIIFIYPD